jgi:hypothetical protein
VTIVNEPGTQRSTGEFIVTFPRTQHKGSDRRAEVQPRNADKTSCRHVRTGRMTTDDASGEAQTGPFPTPGRAFAMPVQQQSTAVRMGASCLSRTSTGDQGHGRSP